MKAYGSFREIRNDLQNGAISCCDLVHHHLSKIRDKASLNAFLSVFEEEALHCRVANRARNRFRRLLFSLEFRVYLQILILFLVIFHEAASLRDAAFCESRRDSPKCFAHLLVQSCLSTFQGIENEGIEVAPGRYDLLAESSREGRIVGIIVL